MDTSWDQENRTVLRSRDMGEDEGGEGYGLSWRAHVENVGTPTRELTQGQKLGEVYCWEGPDLLELGQHWRLFRPQAAGKT